MAHKPMASAESLDDGQVEALDSKPIEPSSDFLKKAEAESGVNISACYGCNKCSNGCPVAFAMDLHPYQVVRYVQLGMVDQLKDCETIWVCSSCQTCVTRCPNDVDLPRMMDYLKETVARERRPVSQKRVLQFHQIFMSEIKTWGRVFEGSLMTRYMFKSGDFTDPKKAVKDARLGWAMFKRGRLRLLPDRNKDRKWLKELFREEGKSS
ncbi:MAG: 4Fe-4S dicluster domain-containing protein [Deltaproteobacteria bacterium]|nr:4Fe-4S dicluster domain-containing protein [Deltaproteobacteria bacterium]